MNKLEQAVKSFNLLKQEVKEANILLATKTINANFLLEFVKQTNHLHYGENYAKELAKWQNIIDIFPNINLSFIGKFQSGNIKKIVKYCNTIEGISSFEDLKKIKLEAQKIHKQVNVYAQINIANEEQKNGFILNNINVLDLKQFDGLMCIPPKKNYQLYFKKMYDLKLTLGIKNLSMGMSQDYKEAILYGSTEIRIGSLIFGERKIKINN